MYANPVIGHRPRATGARAVWFPLLLLVMLAACAGNPREEARSEEEATVRVENRSWSEMTIYALAGGQRVRLGSVTANNTAVMRIPAGVVGLGRNLTFVADPLGSSRRSTSFEIFVRPGEEITLMIPPQAGAD